MAVSKPSWLRYWLDKLNWDIFVWKVYVGDAIERAIDWAIDRVNDSLALASAAFDKAWDAYYKALEVARQLRDMGYREIQDLWDRISTWWDDLNDWWKAKRSWIYDLIDATKDTLQARIKDAWSAIDRVQAAWDSFRRDTLPSLLSMDYWTAFWGGRVRSAQDWWAARWQQIQDTREAALSPIRAILKDHSSKLDVISELFKDPEKWLLDRIESMLARFW